MQLAPDNPSPLKNRKRRNPGDRPSGRSSRERRQEERRNDPRWLTTAHTPREEEEEQDWRKRMLELHLEPVGILDLVLRIGVRQRSPGGER
jgi:hypothetical protein